MECKKDQIYGQLKRAIMDGTLPPGSRLPTEKQLSRSLSVGQVTLRSALARLEAEGLVERVRSRGTFVTERSKRKVFLLIQPDGTENLETPSRYIAAGLDECAEKHCVTLEICPESLFTAFTPEERAEIIRSHNISGIVLETGHRSVSPQMVQAVRQLQLPVVIPHGIEENAFPGVLLLLTNEKQAFSEAYELLAGYGHKKIASLFLSIPEERQKKTRGFSAEELQTFLREKGLEQSCSLIVRLDNIQDDIRDQIKLWMALPEPPTAVLCHSDRVAMRVYAVLRELNIRVPEDISVMGYSNYPGGQLLLPPLTTIDTRLKECAAMALEKLLDPAPWYRQDLIPEFVFTPYSLIERSSVAKINRAKKGG